MGVAEAAWLELSAKIAIRMAEFIIDLWAGRYIIALKRDSGLSMRGQGARRSAETVVPRFLVAHFNAFQ